MLKPASVRTALTTSIVGGDGARLFERDPDKLMIWTDKGRIAARHGGGPSFEYRYRLNVLIQDFTGDENAVALVLVEWIRVNQPELLLNHQKGDEAIPFQVDVLDGGTVDLLFELELSETVRAIARDAGGFDLVHEPEPELDPALDDAPLRPPLTRVYSGGELVIDATG